MSTSSRSRTALVLAGAVAKGAFEAGALEVLHQRGMRFSRVVAASSGAINGAYWTAATRAGREDEAASALPALWRNHAGVGIFHLTLQGVLGERGLSTTDCISALLESSVGSWLPGHRQHAELRLLVTPLRGVEGRIGEQRATTYQQVIKFRDGAFDTRESRAEIFRAATASGAFPLAFVPVDLPELGGCVDGGTVNNAPVREAIDGADVDRVIVVTTNPIVSQIPRVPDRGLKLVGRIADILINERLYRDLQETESVNAKLAALERLRADGTLDEGQFAKVMKAVNLGQAKHLEIIQVRPAKELAGNSFSGFFSRARREEYLEAGRVAASEVFARGLVT